MRKLAVLAVVLTASQAISEDTRIYRINWDYGGCDSFGVISESELKYCHIWDNPGEQAISDANCGTYTYTQLPSGQLKATEIADGIMTFKIYADSRKADASFLNAAGKFYFAESPE